MSDPADRQLTSDEAFRAAFYMIDRYLSLDTDPSGDLSLLWVYMQSDPARGSDWDESIQRAIRFRMGFADRRPVAQLGRLRSTSTLANTTGHLNSSTPAAVTLRRRQAAERRTQPRNDARRDTGQAPVV